MNSEDGIRGRNQIVRFLSGRVSTIKRNSSKKAKHSLADEKTNPLRDNTEVRKAKSEKGM